MMKSPLNEDASSIAVIWRRDAFVTYLHNLNCWTSCHHFVGYSGDGKLYIHHLQTKPKAVCVCASFETVNPRIPGQSRIGGSPRLVMPFATSMVPPIKKPRLSALLLILARILQDMLRMAKKNTPGDNDFSLLVKLVLFEKLQKLSSYIRMKLRRLECPRFSDLRKKRWISAWNLQDEATLITFFMVVEDTAFWKHWAFSDPVLLWIVVFDAGQRCKTRWMIVISKLVIW